MQSENQETGTEDMGAGTETAENAEAKLKAYLATNPAPETPTPAAPGPRAIESARERQDREIKVTKQFRVELDGVLQKIKSQQAGGGESEERTIAEMKLKEAIMWLGMDLKARNEPSPYPNSYNPGNAIVEPTADGLKL